MYTTRLMSYSRHPKLARYFSQSFILNCNKATENKTPNTMDISSGRPMRLNNFQKRVLVWVKRYPDTASVPDVVPQEILNQGLNKARIKTCNYMIGATILLFIWSVYSGKSRARRGESLQKQKQEWYERLREEGKAEREASK